MLVVQFIPQINQDSGMDNVTQTKLSDQDFKDLFRENVQFGGKTIGEGKTRMSDKWSASRITENGCEKYVISRHVSRLHKSHGNFTIEITKDQLKDNKLDNKTIAKMKMLDIIAQGGSKCTCAEAQQIFKEYIKYNGLDDVVQTFQKLHTTNKREKFFKTQIENYLKENDFESNLMEILNNSGLEDSEKNTKNNREADINIIKNAHALHKAGLWKFPDNTLQQINKFLITSDNSAQLNNSATVSVVNNAPNDDSKDNQSVNDDKNHTDSIPYVISYDIPIEEIPGDDGEQTNNVFGNNQNFTVSVDQTTITLSDKWKQGEVTETKQNIDGVATTVRLLTLSRPVSKISRSKGMLTVTIALQEGESSDTPIADLIKGHPELASKMKMLDVVAQSGGKSESTTEVKQVFGNYIDQNGLADIVYTLTEMQSNNVDQNTIAFFKKQIGSCLKDHQKVTDALELLNQNTLSADDIKTLQAFRDLGNSGLLSEEQVATFYKFQADVVIKAGLRQYGVVKEEDVILVKQLFSDVKDKGLNQEEAIIVNDMLKDKGAQEFLVKADVFQLLGTQVLPDFDITTHTHKAIQLSDGRIACCFYNITTLSQLNNFVPYIHIFKPETGETYINADGTMQKNVENSTDHLDNFKLNVGNGFNAITIVETTAKTSEEAKKEAEGTISNVEEAETEVASVKTLVEELQQNSIATDSDTAKAKAEQKRTDVTERNKNSGTQLPTAVAFVASSTANGAAGRAQKAAKRAKTAVEKGNLTEAMVELAEAEAELEFAQQASQRTQAAAQEAAQAAAKAQNTAQDQAELGCSKLDQFLSGFGVIMEYVGDIFVSAAKTNCCQIQEKKEIKDNTGKDLNIGVFKTVAVGQLPTRVPAILKDAIGSLEQNLKKHGANKAINSWCITNQQTILKIISEDKINELSALVEAQQEEKINCDDLQQVVNGLKFLRDVFTQISDNKSIEMVLNAMDKSNQ